MKRVHLRTSLPRLRPENSNAMTFPGLHQALRARGPRNFTVSLVSPIVTRTTVAGSKNMLGEVS